MIFGIGVDIINNDRIKESIEKFGDRFLKRVYSDEELEYCLSKTEPIPCLAARFSLKEAFIKALNVRDGDVGVRFKDIKLVGSGKAKKNIEIVGTASDFLLARGIDNYKIHFSISHGRNYSIAFVVIEVMQ